MTDHTTAEGVDLDEGFLAAFDANGVLQMIEQTDCAIPPEKEKSMEQQQYLTAEQMIRLEVSRLLLQRADRDASDVENLLADLDRISKAVIGNEGAHE